jgi:hypothetical protein
MPVNPIQFSPRPAQKDTLDKVLQGLQIAEAAFKIPVNYEQFRTYRAEAGMKEDERAGITTKAKIGQSGGVIVPSASSPSAPSPTAAAGASASPSSGLMPQPARYGAPLVPMKVREGDGVKDVMVSNPEADQKFFEGEKGLRGEYESHPLTKDTTATLTAAKKALNALADPKMSGADAIAATYGFMHTVESNSAVKSDEYNNVAKSAGYFDNLANLTNQIKSGNFLGTEGRKNLAATIGKMVNAQLSVQDVLDDRYTNLANDRKYKPTNVVTGFWAQDDSPIRPLKKPEGAKQEAWDKMSHVSKRKALALLAQKRAPNSEDEE